MKSSESLKAFAEAMVKVQSEVSVAVKDTKNPFFKSEYADLSAVWSACRAALTKNGFSVIQVVFTDEEKKPALSTMLLHTSGEFVRGDVQLPLSKAGPQELGSCIKYMRRYALASIVGVVDGKDDDAELAEGRNASRPLNEQKRAAIESKSETNGQAWGEDENRSETNLPPLPYVRYPLSEKQVNRLYAIANSNKWSPKYVDAYLNDAFKRKAKDLSKQQYDEACSFFQATECTKEHKDMFEQHAVKRTPVMDAFETAKKENKSAPTFDNNEPLPF